MRTDAPRPRRAPVFSLPPCTAHSLFSQKREWGVHWTSPQRAADHPARQREYRPPLRQRSAPPPRPSGRAPAPLSGGKRKPPQATWLRANHKSAVPPEFPLRDTRLPSNGGTSVAAYSLLQPRRSGTTSPAALETLSPTASSLGLGRPGTASLPCVYMDASILSPPGIVKRGAGFPSSAG